MTTETTKHTPTGKCECQWDEHFEDRPVPRTVRHAYKGPGAEARPAAGRYVLERTRLSEVRAVSDPPRHGCPPAPDRGGVVSSSSLGVRSMWIMDARL